MTSAAALAPAADTDLERLLEIDNVSVTFQSRRGVRRATWMVRAVDGVSLEVRRGETVGLVGESGSGKSTLARAICGLTPYTGSIRIDDKDLSTFTGRRASEAARLRQIVFQDPYSSLNPTMTVADIIAEPLRALGRGSASDAYDRAVEMLERVQLPASFATRLPRELSGGQRQRVAIARAIAAEPPLVICDEALSALDVSTQREVLELLSDLSSRTNLAYLFIAHDLAVVRNFDRVAVMYFGRLVEVGTTDEVFGQPAHPYTKTLLAAAPVPDPRRQRARGRTIVRGELPDPAARPTGCVFHPRCPDAMDVCRAEAPTPVRLASGVEVSCHLHTDGPRAEVASRQRLN